MPKVAIIGSQTQGACSSPPTVIRNGSKNVFIEGVGASYVGSGIIPHKRSGAKRVHSGNVIEGSPNVFVNGIPLARIGDPISCGDIIAKGASTVSAN